MYKTSEIYIIIISLKVFHHQHDILFRKKISFSFFPFTFLTSYFINGIWRVLTPKFNYTILKWWKNRYHHHHHRHRRHLNTSDFY